MNKKVNIIITVLTLALLSMVSVPCVEAAMEGNVNAGAGVQFVENETETTTPTDSSGSSGSGTQPSGSGTVTKPGVGGGKEGGGKYLPQLGGVAGGSFLIVLGALLIGYVLRKKQQIQQP